MQWIDVVKNLGIFSIGTVSLVGLLGFLGKSVFNNWLSRSLENHRQKLSNETELHKIQLANQLEQHRASLQQEINLHEIKNNRLHNDRADTIKELYKKVARVDQSLSDLVSLLQIAGEPSKEDKNKEFVKKYNDFNLFFMENRIFFNTETCEKVETIREIAFKVWNTFTAYDLHLEKEITKGDREVWINSSKEIKEKLPALMENLEDNFREILGVV